MVYRGKLSAGCKQCISRRIRCDRRIGGCGQCWRKGLECSGYRNELERAMPAYLNQTADTMRKHGGRVLPLDPRSRARRLGRASEVNLPCISTYPIQDVDTIALAYCYHRHIIPSAPPTIKDEKLLMCMKALGFASYSNLTRSSRCFCQAAEYYKTAIMLINADLKCAEKAIQDSTLLSIFFLSCYEFTACTNLSQFSESWTRHVKGLCTLIGLRGPEQLGTMEGRYLFVLSCSFILRDHMRSGIPIPDHIGQMLDSIVQREHRWRPLSLLLKIANLRAAVILGAITAPNAIIARAQALDAELASVYSVAPAGYEVQYLDWPGEAGWLLPTCLYTYRSPAAAMLWNTIRGGRTACHGLIIDVIQRFPSTRVLTALRSEIEISQTVIRCMQIDILASIPHILIMAGANPLEVITGLSSGSSPCRATWPSTSVIPNQDMKAGRLPMLALTRGYALTFQLASAGRLADKRSPIREAFCKVLRFLGTRMGFPIALHFANALDDHHGAYLTADHEDVIASGPLAALGSANSQGFFL